MDFYNVKIMSVTLPEKLEFLIYAFCCFISISMLKFANIVYNYFFLEPKSNKTITSRMLDANNISARSYVYDI